MIIGHDSNIIHNFSALLVKPILTLDAHNISKYPRKKVFV